MGFIASDEGFVIEVNGEVVGTIQYGEEDPMYRHANMGIFLASSCHSRGLGAEAIRVLRPASLRGARSPCLTIDPAADNVAMIRAYERAGFRRIGIMRSCIQHCGYHPQVHLL